MTIYQIVRSCSSINSCMGVCECHECVCVCVCVCVLCVSNVPVIGIRTQLAIARTSLAIYIHDDATLHPTS